MIITKKIQILPAESCKDQFYEFIKEMDKQVYKIKNKCMQAYQSADAYEQMYAAEQSPEQVPKKTFNTEWYRKNLGTSKQNLGYRATTEFENIPSQIRGAISNSVWLDYRNDYKDIFSGRKTVRNYRYGCPIPFTKESLLKMTEDGFSFFSFEMIFAYGIDKSGNRKTIKEVLSGKYSLCNSSIKRVGKKVFVYLCLDIPKKEHSLKENVNLLVDLSFKYPLHISNNANSVAKEIGNILHLQKLRMGLKQQYEKFQGTLILAKGGKGRKRKLKALSVFEEKEKNIAKTLTHQATALIIKEALKIGAKNIHIIGEKQDVERLEGENKDFIHRFWGYHQIIAQIKYKAQLNGIEVIDDFKNPDGKSKDDNQ